MASLVASYEPSFSRTLMWVAAGHALLILILLLAIWWTPARARETKFINLVPMGELVRGTPTATAQAAQAPAAAPAPAPEPTPAPPVTTSPKPAAPKLVVKPTEAPDPQPVAKPKAEPRPAPTPEPKPAPPVAKKEPVPPKKTERPKIKVSLKEVKRPSDTPKKVALRTPSEPEQVLAKLDAVLKKAGSIAAPDRPRRSGAPDGTEDDFSAYYLLIRNQMFGAWDHPLHLMDQRLVTVVRIELDPSGRILDVQLEQSSGNDEHDASALAAARSVRKISRPLPPGMDPQVNITFRLTR
ncbi:MAG: TonB family protein [Verrucomicrobiota bacterium]